MYFIVAFELHNKDHDKKFNEVEFRQEVIKFLTGKGLRARQLIKDFFVVPCKETSFEQKRDVLLELVRNAVEKKHMEIFITPPIASSKIYGYYGGEVKD
ncbi:MAG: hypothetical protein HQK60_10405 [Deltaproteobacteria bacterium]|nr:hypothetical protein [Deltaproteobacteria bacterium]